MSKPVKLPPDQQQRMRALDPARSILVQAPAGSGKTDLLTRRFLRLLGEVDVPEQIVAITFTRAAAAEMRHRILSELEKAARSDAAEPSSDTFCMSALALRALERSRALDWQLLDLPAQLHITTIDSFCRELALQQPLLTKLGGELTISEQPANLYRISARHTLSQIDGSDQALRTAIEALLLWRDNNWQEMEDLLVRMLEQRDRWMQEFVLQRDPDWNVLRARLERPFAHAVRHALNEMEMMFSQVPGAREEVLALARFACEQSNGEHHQELAELPEFPAATCKDDEGLEDARQAWLNLADMLLTSYGAFRKQVTKSQGFPAECKEEKARLLALIQALGQVNGFESALATVRDLPPARFTDEDWEIVQSCFVLLRHAAAELQITFAEAGSVDFIEVAQIAQRVLRGEEALPSEAAIAVADGIRHLLVDEFQDTSRRQHRLLSSLAAAWPDQAGRTLFVVGDPMQSIYAFRDADAELFPRVRDAGLELPDGESIAFEAVSLTANFRTEPALVSKLNEAFDRVFAEDDGSGVEFKRAEAARDAAATTIPRLALHMDFMPASGQGRVAAQDKKETAKEREAALASQVSRILELIRSHMARMKEAHAQGGTYRIAVLGRARTALAPIAAALRQASIPFRAVELEKLRDRPEVRDALALARALLNPQDRVAWLGTLRAPWCGLALDDLHRLTSADDAQTSLRAIPELLRERLHLLSDDGRAAVVRVLSMLESMQRLRASLPTASLGTRLEQVWRRIGGPQCVDSTARANLDLLWRCLDRLPDGERDLLSPALDDALEKLTALPDTSASSECGVQLMTIHKAKGLEFEVVIVPELQAGGGNNHPRLLSWLERGLEKADDTGEITEFLIAPLQPKRADRGKARQWVEHVYREREKQEMRRILYVAATRAREELHFFARPAYRELDGDLKLVKPSDSLLATAWPAIHADVHAQFEQWKNSRASMAAAEEPMLETIAAEGESNLRVMPSVPRPTIIRRLPSDFQPAPHSEQAFKAQDAGSAARLYERHEGGLLSRALGSAAHRLLEELARLRKEHEWAEARAALLQMRPRIMAEVRAAGVPQSQAEAVADEALACALNASQDAHGQWILSPHADSASEVAWTGVVAGALRSVRVDRVFRAGAGPLSGQDDTWWIIDYKTAHADNLNPAEVLPELRNAFAPQLEAYAIVLRKLHGGHLRLNAGLYYPRMALLDWWEVQG